MNTLKKYRRTNILSILLLVNSFLIYSQDECWKSVATGTNHSLAIKNDGTLWAWGTNSRGQLGNSTVIHELIPVRIGNSSDWKYVAAGSETSFAIKEDGTLWSWGSNYSGELGNGTTSESVPTPTQIGTALWKDVSSTLRATLGIQVNGTIWAWGEDGYGMLGNGFIYESHVPLQIGTANNWKQVSSGDYHVLAIKNDNTLWGWGYGGNGQLGNGSGTTFRVPTQAGVLNTWKEVSAGNNFSKAIKNDGTLWAWGSNLYGQLGNGTTGGNNNIPLQVGTASNWLHVASGFSNTIAVKSDGTLWAWGPNSSGQLGNGTDNESYIPSQVGSQVGWIQANIDNHGAAVKGDGSLWTWGAGGLLGNNQTVDSYSPIDIGCPETLSIDGFSTNDDFTIFQNNGQLFIKTASGLPIKDLKVVDITGKELLHENETTSEINLQQLAQGIYILLIYTDQKMVSKKFIKFK